MGKSTIHHRGGISHWTAMLLLAGSLAMSGCMSDGEDGAPGPAGPPGPQGEPGVSGSTGTTTPAATSIKVADIHGKANAVQATKGANNSANLCTTITSASVGTDGKLTVNFDVKSSGADLIPCTADDVPYKGLAANMMSFVVAQLRPGDGPGDSSYWVNYVNSSKTKATTVTGPGTAPDGTKMSQPGTISGATGGAWTDKGNGSYTFVTNQALTAGITIVDPPKPGNYAYDPNLVHRVAAQMGDYDGPTGPATHGANNPVYDFVPATGVKVDDPREIVVVQNCNECHQTLSFHGSNGQRLDTKLCVTCHNATAGDPESGNVLDLKVMAHKIHMGRNLPSVGFDFAGESSGLYNNDPEAAVKGTPYIIWGHNNSKHEWSEVAFPANVANCTKCHKDATQGANWMTQPTKEVCGSCHDGINFDTGKGKRLASVPFTGSKITGDKTAIDHAGGPRADNSSCTTCHQSTGTLEPLPRAYAPVPASHDMVAKTKTDYTLDVTMSDPANGTHYVAGETPVVTVVIKDKTTGTVINHDDTNLTDKNFSSAHLYVYGPRALKKPVLTKVAADPTFFSTTTPKAPASTAGNPLWHDTRTVAVDGVDGIDDPQATRSAGSVQYQLSDIAGLQPGTYFVFVRVNKKGSKNSESFVLKEFQVGTATPEKQVAVCTTCHENTMWHDSPGKGGNHPAPFNPDACSACHDYDANANAKLGLLVDGSNTKWKGGGVCVNNGGTPDATGATVTQADLLASTADDTVDTSIVVQNDCLTTANRKWMGSVCIVGGVIDATMPNDTRDKITGLKPCTDIASGTWTSYGANNMGFGAAPIARRVHGVHAGKPANSPLTTMNYPFEIYNGHNVAIQFPQDVKNCETCHTAATSGTWSSNPGRVACLACHDSDAAQAHGTLMTVDATPYADAQGTLPGPFSGDESESCPVCHN